MPVRPAGCGRFIAVLLALACLASAGLAAKTWEVRDAEGLREALRALREGDTLAIGPGTYPGGHSIQGLARITVRALDPAKPPLFQAGAQAWHFVRCEGLTVRNLRLRGQTANGLNADDGGQLDRPVRGVTLEDLEVTDVGPKGNFDAIKASGLDDLVIRNCRISGWGGQAIDLVGCHRVRISGCRIVGKPGFSQTTGPQFKGGCEDVVMEDCQLLDAGTRPVNIGGSTGEAFFRPPGALFEARRITVRHNLIEGGECAAAFVGVDGAVFADNTLRFPRKWIFRILQETTRDGFPPCRNVEVARNAIRFRRAEIGTEVNVGPNTRPESFRFLTNRWLAEDQPARSKPSLPAPEDGGIYGSDALLRTFPRWKAGTLPMERQEALAGVLERRIRILGGIDGGTLAEAVEWLSAKANRPADARAEGGPAANLDVRGGIGDAPVRRFEVRDAGFCTAVDRLAAAAGCFWTIEENAVVLQPADPPTR